MVREIGVKGDAISLGKRSALAVDDEVEGAFFEEDGFPRAWLVDRAVAIAAGCCLRLEGVLAERDALAGQWRGEHFVAVAL